MSAAGFIAARFAEWGFVPRLFEASFGTAEPAAVAALVDAFARAALGAGVAGYELLRASVGSVHGLRLEDGRTVVLKVHRPGVSPRYLAAAQEVQARLAAGGFPCPAPLLGPTPLGRGIAVAETYLADCGRADAHEPAVRRAMAGALAELVGRCRGFAPPAGLEERFHAVPPGGLWPPPHDLRFDFGGTDAYAGWIDELGERARARLDTGAPRVVGHGDWSVQNVRLAGGAVGAVYDWDSVVLEPEAAIAGAAAHAFTADWSAPEGWRQLPDADEALAFIDDYERARGTPFDADERRAARAALVYGLAYMARCELSDELTGMGEHAPTGRAQAVPAGGARALLLDHADGLLG